jgi:hypothetical protein
VEGREWRALLALRRSPMEEADRTGAAAPIHHLQYARGFFLMEVRAEGTAVVAPSYSCRGTRGVFWPRGCSAELLCNRCSKARGAGSDKG